MSCRNCSGPNLINSGYCYVCSTLPVIARFVLKDKGDGSSNLIGAVRAVRALFRDISLREAKDFCEGKVSVLIRGGRFDLYAQMLDSWGSLDSADLHIANPDNPY